MPKLLSPMRFTMLHAISVFMSAGATLIASTMWKDDNGSECAWRWQLLSVARVVRIAPAQAIASRHGRLETTELQTRELSAPSNDAQVSSERACLSARTEDRVSSSSFCRHSGVQAQKQSSDSQPQHALPAAELKGG